jgi:hypothetical protein
MSMTWLPTPATWLTFIGVLGLSVAVAIGAAAFGIISNFFAGSLPLDEGDRIVAIQNLNRGSDDRGRPLHLHDLTTGGAPTFAPSAPSAHTAALTAISSRTTDAPSPFASPR